MILITHNKKNMNVPCVLIAANPKQNLHNRRKRVQDGYKAT
jgi:hypothetical protein